MPALADTPRGLEGPPSQSLADATALLEAAESSRRYAFIVPWLRRWTPSRIYGPGSATMMEHRPAWIRQAQGDEAGALEAIGEAIRLRGCHWATTSGYPQPHPGSADSTPTGTSR